MRKIAGKLREGILSKIQPPSGDAQPSVMLTTSPEHLYRYRKHRGVNLGSWFVLERWITDAPFRSANAPANSDLDVARGSNARDILEKHWDTWIVEDDWAWISERGFNAVRIP
ncbi:hypothetical protein H0H93_010128, partial [Arthromyces matolae]